MPGGQGSDGDRRLLDRAGFAQEFLRRNPLYRADWEKVGRMQKGSVQEQEVMAQQWGLSFPMRAVRLRRGRARALAGGAVTYDRHPRYGAVRRGRCGPIRYRRLADHPG